MQIWRRKMIRKGKRTKKEGKRNKYGRSIGAIKMEREGAEEEWKGKEKRKKKRGNEKEAKEVRRREERGSLIVF